MPGSLDLCFAGISFIVLAHRKVCNEIPKMQVAIVKHYR